MIKIETSYQLEKTYNPILNIRYESDIYLEFIIINTSNSDHIIHEISMKTYFWFIPIKKRKLNIKAFKLKGKSKVSFYTYIPKTMKHKIVVNNLYFSDKFRKKQFLPF